MRRERIVGGRLTRGNGTTEDQLVVEQRIGFGLRGFRSRLGWSGSRLLVEPSGVGGRSRLAREHRILRTRRRQRERRRLRRRSWRWRGGRRLKPDRLGSGRRRGRHRFEDQVVDGRGLAVFLHPADEERCLLDPGAGALKAAFGGVGGAGRRLEEGVGQLVDALLGFVGVRARGVSRGAGGRLGLQPGFLEQRHRLARIVRGLRRFGVDGFRGFQGRGDCVRDCIAQALCGGLGRGGGKFAGLGGGLDHAGRLHQLFVEAHQDAGEVLRTLAAFGAHRVELRNALGEMAGGFVHVTQTLVDRGVGLADLFLSGAGCVRHELGVSRNRLGQRVGLVAQVFGQLGKALPLGPHLVDQHLAVGADDLRGLQRGGDAHFDVALEPIEAMAGFAQRAVDRLGFAGDGLGQAGDFLARRISRLQQEPRRCQDNRVGL